MSYLTLPNGIPNFSKAVFSLWFRVPRESVIAASTHSLPTDDENFFMMQHVLPLLTYGVVQTNANYQLMYKDIVGTKPPGSDIVVIQPVGYQRHTPYEVDPCMIGLVCSDDGMFNLAFNIQMGDKGSYQSLIWFVTGLDYVEDSTEGNIPGSGFVGTGTGAYKTTIVDGTYGIQDAQNEFFYVETEISLEPDKWHHLLLSFDVDGSLTVGEHPSSDCQLWYAIDDVDYRGPENMGPFRDAPDDGLGSNTILTSNVYRQSGVIPPEGGRLFFNNYIAEPSGSYSPQSIPSNGSELGFPAAAHYMEGIFRCEMAEFQMWTGVTLDTDINSNRRVFIDEDGNPVSPTEGATENDPRGPAEKLLGKKPDVLLHGSSNWKIGKNTGTTGIEINSAGEEILIPGGQFIPTGGIEKYKPEPALTETPTA